MNDSQAVPINPGRSAEVWSIEVDAPLQSVLDRPDCPPLFHKTLTRTVSWQTRNRVTIERALASPGIAPQWWAALLALGATVVVNAAEGTGAPPCAPSEAVSLEAFAERRVKGKAEALHVKVEGVRWGEARVARTPADEPIVAAVACVEMDDPSDAPAGAALQGRFVRQARVALTGTWPRPVGLAQAPAWLIGGPLDADRIRQVAAAVADEVMPRGDFLGSEEYRRAMAGILTSRALQACLAEGGN